MKPLYRSALLVGAVGVVSAIAARTIAGQEPPVGVKTPPEITIQPTPPGPMFADVNGYALYVTDRDSEPNQSSCNGPCTVEWPPLRASADAKPFGDWTLVPRDDGAPQWAYKGRPLYRYAREGKPLWAEAQGEYWRYALVSPFPARGVGRRGGGFTQGSPQRQIIPVPPRTPGGITGQPSGLGPVFADSKGFTLYVQATVSPCVGQCLDAWKPLPAPLLASPVGDWTIITRPDGQVQWAYKSKPLYRSTKDLKSGDTNGEGADWHVLRLPHAALSTGSAPPASVSAAQASPSSPAKR